MTPQYLQKKNRIWLTVNYVSLLLIMTFVFLVRSASWTPIYTFLVVASMILFLISFMRAFIRTQFWKMVHSSSKKLDEREMQVVLNALKYSYSIFTIMIVLTMYLLAILDIHMLELLIAGAYLYLAHTLPAAVVGWNTRTLTLYDD